MQNGVETKFESPITANKPRILIVEDDTPLAMMMVSLLMRAGCDVQTAWNAEKAMRLAQDEDFDLITLDVDLPSTNGFEICSRLKENLRSSDTPIVFVSGRPHAEDRQRAFELGADDYITKPFETFEFAPRILSHIIRKASAADMDIEVPIES
jgi:DNA-binding response OmpR family regulator